MVGLHLMQENSIYFSIIIPTFNRANFMEETIRSVQNQTYTDWECIVVDDGSTDHTKELIGEISRNDPRVRYVYQKNAERSAARNNGIRHSRGNYVCFLDSDDFFESGYLFELNHFIEQNKIDKGFIICNFNNWDGINKVTNQVPAMKDPKSDWLFINPVSPSRVCVSKQILEQFNFDERITIVEDTVLWVSILNVFPVFHLERALVNYRVHNQNSVNPNSGSCFERYKGLKLFFRNKLSEIVSKKIKKRMLSETLFRMAEYYQLHENKKMAFWKAIQSILTDPFHYQTKMRIYFFKTLIYRIQDK